MRILIIEDELPQAKQLQQYIVEIDSSFEIQAIISSVEDAVAYLSQQSVDLIFLDIHLSDGLCFDIFNKATISCPVIFTTAYDQYAIQAFKHNGIDYLLKPIDKEEVRKSIVKFKSFTHSTVNYTDILNSLRNIENGSQNYKKRFVSHLGKKLRIVTDTDIAYFYAFGGGVYIRTKKNEDLLIDQTLETIEQEIDPYNFFRLNRKIISHISAIKEMIPYSKSRLKIELIPAFPEEVIVSYNNTGNFMKWIKK